MDPSKDWPSLLRRITGWQPYVDRKAIFVKSVVRVDHGLSIYNIFWLGTDIAVLRTIKGTVAAVDIVLGKLFGRLPPSRIGRRQCVRDLRKSLDTVGEHGAFQLPMRSKVQCDCAGWLHYVAHYVYTLVQERHVVVVRTVYILCLPLAGHVS